MAESSATVGVTEQLREKGDELFRAIGAALVDTPQTRWKANHSGLIPPPLRSLLVPVRHRYRKDYVQQTVAMDFMLRVDGEHHSERTGGAFLNTMVWEDESVEAMPLARVPRFPRTRTRRYAIEPHYRELVAPEWQTGDPDVARMDVTNHYGAEQNGWIAKAPKGRYEFWFDATDTLVATMATFADTPTPADIRPAQHMETYGLQVDDNDPAVALEAVERALPYLQ